MIVTFRDSLGYVAVKVDQYGISFSQSNGDGIFAVFSDGAKEYSIHTTNLVSIQEGNEHDKSRTV